MAESPLCGFNFPFWSKKAPLRQVERGLIGVIFERSIKRSAAAQQGKQAETTEQDRSRRGSRG